MLSTFSFPTTVLFGVGAIQELATRLAALHLSKPLLVTDPGLLKTSVVQKVQQVLGKPAALFSAVTANPIEQDVESGAEAYRNAGCDSVIALGGGSALDVGKIIRLRIKQPEMRLSQFTGKDPGTLPQLIAIPTTAGTGSEVGRSSVIIIANKKRVIFHPSLLASLVILDPQLTGDLPPRLTAATRADALTHCIESFTSPTFHPPCDGIALEGIRLIADALPRAVKDGHDLDARGKMQVAAMMGGIAFQKDLGAVHSLAHPLSAICGVHHGLANALCLVPVMEFNARLKPGLYRLVGQAMGLSDTGDAEVIAQIR